MQTLYIDIYFLINFTVDLLALYFAALLSKVQSTVARLVICSFIASLFACYVVLCNPAPVFLILLIIAVASIISYIFVTHSSLIRKVKFFISFLILETFIGGLVNWIYNLMDKYIYPNFSENNFGVENRKLLILSVIVLLSYGLLKLLFLIFSGTKSEKNIEFVLHLFGQSEKFTALIDSGNLLIDPMNNKPVILIKKNAVKLLGKYKDLPNCEDENIKKRIRLIPAKGLGVKKILIGIRCDYITLNNDKIKYNNTVIALDDEEGTYGGYSALMPSSLADYMS